MPNRSRQKGDRAERKIVELHRAVAGVDAQRVPLSGSAGGKFAGDLTIDLAGDVSMLGEVKARADGSEWKWPKRWLEGVDLLFLVEDRKTPLVVMGWDTYRSFLWKAAAVDHEAEYAYDDDLTCGYDDFDDAGVDSPGEEEE